MPTEKSPARLTEHVAQFAAATRFEDIPPEVMRLSKQAVLDCFAVAFAGSVAEGSAILRRHIANLGFSGGNATVYAGNMRDIAFTDAVADFVQADFDEDLVLTDAATPKPKRGKKKGPQRGWAIGGATGQPHTLALLAEQTVEAPPGAKLLVTIEQQSPFEKLTLGHFRIATTDDARVGDFLRTPACRDRHRQRTGRRLLRPRNRAGLEC